MPFSDWKFDEPTVNQIMSIQPYKVLDVGVGLGKWGKAIRNTFPDCIIHGVEVYEPYITDELLVIYDTIFLSDVRSILPRLDNDYDIIIFGDVLEHMAFEDAERILNESLEKSMYVIVNTPNGFLPQGEWRGNIFEEHLSGFTIETFHEFDIIEAYDLGNVINVLIKGNRMLKDI